ncbi:hypothetical protein F9C07_6141 [Aspergillus flavus]|uniref:Uncharacterized protein n=1 Tax=Aspergillus flavus (strain ATCC 200026 / FGSC A1120 / IAM 13836 / NRRL 3357 / JCM 12722 / SRRC 167) TaxID=332952 RepID=A0A7U2MIA8_ASPFN|nr:hypothetical protein F9C07_6141 [Aspergillus flavus]
MTALFYGLQITYEWRQSLSIPPNRFNYLPTSDINVLDSWWDGLTWEYLVYQCMRRDCNWY